MEEAGTRCWGTARGGAVGVTGFLAGLETMLILLQTI